MRLRNNLSFLVVLFIILSIFMGCTVSKKPKKQEDESPKENQSEKAPSDEEKKEQTPEVKEDLKGPMTAEGIKDGKYKGKSEKDENGNYGEAQIVVKDGKVSEAEYSEFTKDNTPKTRESGYDYQQALDAFEKLPDILVEKQDLSKIDTYAGATGSTKTFKMAVMKALEAGKNEK